MINSPLDGPDGFFRSSFVVQETNDTWPVVYVWEGSDVEDSAPVSVFMFQSLRHTTNSTKIPAVWDRPADYQPGNIIDERQPRINLTYAQWWAFIYFLSTEFPKCGDSDVVEENFHNQILQPQTSKEKTNV